MEIGGSIKDQMNLLFNFTKERFLSLSVSQQSALKYGFIAAGVGTTGFSLYKYFTKKSEKKEGTNGKLWERLRFLLSITVPSVK